MSFFIRNKGRPGAGSKQKPARKRKGPAEDVETHGSGKRSTKAKFNSGHEEIPSDIESDEDGQKKHIEESSSDEDETAQEKRLRLAKQYLSQIEQEETEKRDPTVDDDAQEDDAVAVRLKRDLKEQSGLLQRVVADTYEEPSTDSIRVCRGHKLPVTCVVISTDGKHIFSGSKDCSIIKWCTETGKKVKVIHGGRKGTESKHIGHTAHVMCMALSTDSKYLASGDRNKLILAWNAETCELLGTLQGHRDVVSGLAFRKGSHQLFSCSHDRTVKIWNVDSLTYVETLFGHQDQITGIDSLTRERAVTCGGRDNSVRVWKVIEESQLVFHGHSGSIDCIALINETNFLSGADDNSLAVWGLMKKKPLVTVQHAHGGPAPSAGDATPASLANPASSAEDETPTSLANPAPSTEDESLMPAANPAPSAGDATPASLANPAENWITAVASLQNTDLVASGSKDGCVRLWKCCDNFRRLTPLFNVPVTGFVNGLQFSADGRLLIAAVGQEHRLGRWWRLKEAKNSVVIIPLKRSAKPPEGATAVSAAPTAAQAATPRKGSGRKGGGRVVRRKGRR